MLQQEFLMAVQQSYEGLDLRPITIYDSNE